MYGARDTTLIAPEPVVEEPMEVEEPVEEEVPEKKLNLINEK